MAAGAAEGLLLSIYEGCISGCDNTIERRPYHRNCQCALHDKSHGNCPRAFGKSKSVSYPLRRAWSEGCLAVSAASSCHSSPCSSPARLARVHGAAGAHHVESYKEEEEDHNDNKQLESTTNV
ncbi:hypothetical protein HRI_003144000 [Hibiscus trionum]|uniref:Uncharacterized protein n=1 Tax=Hibiscus trionum TaxID=183268 RepID=A0A9W7IGJ1_HIBTR|nr:hypothetical protein HRI_003144000 [Hibiscus trionum]